jgi:hypothetical protein
MTERFDDQLLGEFVQNFYGYGNYRGQFWFIGMEEGGGNKFEEVAKRLDAWALRGQRELEDIAEYHTTIGISGLFRDKPRLQRTWSMLIRILLSREGHAPTNEEILEYQRASLGRSAGDICLMELLPLPSPSTECWLYAKHSGLSYLADRETYKQTCLPSRIKGLQKRISKYAPETVIFYGLSYQESWQEIAGVDLLPESDGVYTGRNGATRFILTKHPAAWGVTKEYFQQVGRLVHADISGRRTRGEPMEIAAHHSGFEA